MSASVGSQNVSIPIVSFPHSPEFPSQSDTQSAENLCPKLVSIICLILIIWKTTQISEVWKDSWAWLALQKLNPEFLALNYVQFVKGLQPLFFRTLTYKRGKFLDGRVQNASVKITKLKKKLVRNLNTEAWHVIPVIRRCNKYLTRILTIRPSKLD
jgi:hypothetical protein